MPSHSKIEYQIQNAAVSRNAVYFSRRRGMRSLGAPITSEPRHCQLASLQSHHRPSTCPAMWTRVTNSASISTSATTAASHSSPPLIAIATDHLAQLSRVSSLQLQRRCSFGDTSLRQRFRDSSTTRVLLWIADAFAWTTCRVTIIAVLVCWRQFWLVDCWCR